MTPTTGLGDRARPAHRHDRREPALGEVLRRGRVLIRGDQGRRHRGAARSSPRPGLSRPPGRCRANAAWPRPRTQRGTPAIPSRQASAVNHVRRPVARSAHRHLGDHGGHRVHPTRPSPKISMRSVTSARTVRTKRSAKQFARGHRGGILTTSMPASARTASNDGRELSGAVADEEPEPGGAVAEIHDEVAGLLGGPGPVGMSGHAQDVQVAVADLEHEQHVEPSQRERAVDVEEVDREHAGGLGAQELPPAGVGVPRPVPVGCGGASGSAGSSRRRRGGRA